MNPLPPKLLLLVVLVTATDREEMGLPWSLGNGPAMGPSPIPGAQKNYAYVVHQERGC